MTLKRPFRIVVNSAEKISDIKCLQVKKLKLYLYRAIYATRSSTSSLCVLYTTARLSS